MRCPCCPSPIHHRVLELTARLEAPAESPSVPWISAELRSILEEDTAREREAVSRLYRAVMEGSEIDLATDDEMEAARREAAEMVYEYDEVPGSDSR